MSHPLVNPAMLHRVFLLFRHAASSVEKPARRLALFRNYPADPQPSLGRTTLSGRCGQATLAFPIGLQGLGFSVHGKSEAPFHQSNVRKSSDFRTLGAPSVRGSIPSVYGS